MRGSVTTDNIASGRSVQMNGDIGNRETISNDMKTTVKAFGPANFTFIQTFPSDRERANDTDPSQVFGQIVDTVFPGQLQGNLNASTPVSSPSSTQRPESEVFNNDSCNTTNQLENGARIVHYHFQAIEALYEEVTNIFETRMDSVESSEILRLLIDEPRGELQQRQADILGPSRCSTHGSNSLPHVKEWLQVTYALHGVKTAVEDALSMLRRNRGPVSISDQAIIDAQRRISTDTGLSTDKGTGDTGISLLTACLAVKRFIRETSELAKLVDDGETTPAIALKQYGRRRDASTTVCDILSQVCHSHTEHQIYINLSMQGGDDKEAAEVMFSLAFEDYSEHARESPSLVWFIAHTFIVCEKGYNSKRKKQKQKDTLGPLQPKRIKKTQKKAEYYQRRHRKLFRTNAAILPQRAGQRSISMIQFCPAGLKQGEGGTCAIQMPLSDEASHMEHKLIFPCTDQLPGRDTHLVPLAEWIKAREAVDRGSPISRTGTLLICAKLSRLIVEAVLELPLGIFSTSQLRSDQIVVFHPTRGNDQDLASVNLEPHVRVRLESRPASNSGSLDIQLASSHNILFGLCVTLLQLADPHMIYDLKYWKDGRVSEQHGDFNKLKNRVLSEYNGGLWHNENYRSAARYCFRKSTGDNNLYNLFQKESQKDFYEKVVICLRKAEEQHKEMYNSVISIIQHST
ncbi:hypothetical protein FMUND_2186 [Fusarium mundagurra]|uniref:Uncharacterized protein n=1 Tax=Fusarium mundagurra TaxID=1567541 RepID=A0A8H5Z2Q3_9HYPO|nr:hypothetical protein FMUND_2186 [Fusarium mundagurra]